MHETLVDRIYEASVVPELWPGVLAGLVQLSGTAWAAVASVRNGEARWAVSSLEADELVRAHFDRFANNTRTARLLARPYPGFITDYDILTQAEIDAEPVYKDFLIPRGYGFGVGTHIVPQTGDSIVVHCEGRFTDGAVRREIADRLDVLRPHLARSALVSARLRFEQARNAVETLSALGLAACAVDQSGIVIVANAGFDTERSFWTTRGAERIALKDRRADRQLYEALGMIATGQGVCSLPLIDAAGGAPAVLHVVPIRLAAHDLFTRAAAILVLTRASDAPTQATSLLQALFDLSVTEAGIAARISAGRTAEQIALADAKSVETVRNQVKSVLQKTGCNRQADLARLLVQLIPPNA
ncbi:helix-turn-helix transcriptional regulator [Mesorhizobium sp. CN2-181]|uniref:helix-turn-helix transcriptional regulator n=1 Tax=Mesorhizobium yinganensis TaxID=3157707 RepID=UPI0032B86C60